MSISNASCRMCCDIILALSIAFLRPLWNPLEIFHPAEFPVYFEGDCVLIPNGADSFYRFVVCVAETDIRWQSSLDGFTWNSCVSLYVDCNHGYALGRCIGGDWLSTSDGSNFHCLDVLFDVAIVDKWAGIPLLHDFQKI